MYGIIHVTEYLQLRVTSRNKQVWQAAWTDAVIQLAVEIHITIKMCKELEDKMWQTKVFSIL